jgi:hypothetical protein
MFNLADYLLSKGVPQEEVERIISKISVTITSPDDFINHNSREVGLPMPLIRVMEAVGINFY